jgi:hypothetical protein
VYHLKIGNLMNKVVIDINEQYRLKRLDKHNWIIEEKYTNTKGKEVWKNVGYFPRIDQAARFLFDKQINEADVKTLKDIEKAVLSSRITIMKAFKRIEL